MKAFKTKMMVGAVAAAVLTIGAAQAAESVKTDEIKVTATRVEKELSDVNMSVSVITEEQIKHSTARNVGELLKDMVGIEINPDGGQGINRANIRGENAFRTVVMIDGQKMAEHKSMSGSPMLIDPSSIERIEVIKGPVSVLYGSDAIGGAINIITKKGGEKPVQGTVSAGYNTSADGWNASASLFGASNGWKYRLTAAAEENDELDTPAGKMEKTSFSSKSAGLFVSYDINEDNTVGLTLDHYDLAFQSSTVDQGPEDGFLVDVPKWERSKMSLFQESRNVTEQLQRVRTDVFYQKSEKDFSNYVHQVIYRDDPSVHMSVDRFEMTTRPNALNKTDQYGFSLQTDWQLSDAHYLVAGYEMSYDKLEAQSWSKSEMKPGRMTINTTKSENYDGHMMSNAVYASMESLLPQDLTLNYGVRYTYVNSEMDIAGHSTKLITPPYGDAMQSRTNMKPEHNKSSDGKAVFNAGILWNGIENLTLRANFAQGYRTPILQELYINSAMGGGNTYANRDLKPETSNNFELGARWSNGSASLDATLFYSEADDYIAKLAGTYYDVQEAEMKQGDKFFNIAEAKTFGLELMASAYLGETGFEPYVNLTLMKRQFDYGMEGEETHKSKSWDTGTPLLTAIYGVRWSGEHNGMNVRWDAYCRSQSSSDYDDLDRGWKPITSTTETYSDGSYKYAGYTTFNIKGGIDFGAQKQYSMDFGLYNVFDKLYQHQGAIYEPGRYAAVKFNAQF